jgi:GNAT superfamily N-acetyltransferase
LSPAQQQPDTSRVRIWDLRANFEDALLSRFYWEVMEPSFGAPELVSIDELRAGVAPESDDGTLMVLALGAEGEVLGGMVGERYPRSDVLLLAYIAVRPEARGRGIGTLLLAHADEHWHRTLRPRLALAEVEHPAFHPKTDRGDPVARLRLYERVGARVLGMPYFQPEVREGAGRVYDMLLLALHVDASITRIEEDETRIDGKVVAGFLDEYFTLAEGSEVLADDPEYQSLRAQADRPEGVLLLPLARYREVPALDVPGRGRSVETLGP